MYSSLLMFQSVWAGLSGAPELHANSLLIAKHRAAAPHRTSRMITKSIYGSVYDTYIAILNINDQPFHVVLDTGSSDTAVAVGAGSGCKNHYDGKCEGPALEVLYGEGNWTGHACSGAEVKLGKLSAGQYVFAGMETQVEMLECSGPSVVGHHRLEGIAGLAYQDLVGPPVDYTVPLLQALCAHQRIPYLFAFQSCGWDGLMLDDPLAHGHLDIGQVRKEHFRGEVSYTPVVKKDYYTVLMTDVLVGGVSVMPTYRHSNLTRSAGIRKPHFVDSEAPDLIVMPDTIIDSGTSAISFTKDLFARLMVELKRQVPSMPQDAWKPDGEGDSRCLRDGEIGAYPELTLEFMGERPGETFALKIPGCRYWMSGDKSEGLNCPGYVFQLDQGEMEDGNIVGSVAYEAYYVIHDNSREPNRVGFASLNGCQVPHMCAVLAQDASIVRSIKGEEQLSIVNPAASAKAVAVITHSVGVGAALGFLGFGVLSLVVLRCALGPVLKADLPADCAI